MFKEMSLKFSIQNDSEIEKVTHPGEVATINQFILNDYPNTDGQFYLFIIYFIIIYLFIYFILFIYLIQEMVVTEIQRRYIQRKNKSM